MVKLAEPHRVVATLNVIPLTFVLRAVVILVAGLLLGAIERALVLLLLLLFLLFAVALAALLAGLR